LTIDPAATSHPLGIFDVGAQQWKVVDGAYNVYVGNSSANIALSDSVTVRKPGKH
jgi:beta-glucosidase